VWCGVVWCAVAKAMPLHDDGIVKFSCLDKAERAVEAST
jgi:hypothetical protein